MTTFYGQIMLSFFYQHSQLCVEVFNIKCDSSESLHEGYKGSKGFNIFLS